MSCSWLKLPPLEVIPDDKEPPFNAKKAIADMLATRKLKPADDSEGASEVRSRRCCLSTVSFLSFLPFFPFFPFFRSFLSSLSFFPLYALWLCCGSRSS
jgi:hypothetical protein